VLSLLQQLLLLCGFREHHVSDLLLLLLRLSLSRLHDVPCLLLPQLLLQLCLLLLQSL
jgi:hypothetical protein